MRHHALLSFFLSFFFFFIMLETLKRMHVPIRSEYYQNTKFSRRRHWKWPRLADDDPPPSSEKNRQAKTHETQADIEKLKDLNVLKSFQAIIGGKSAPLTVINNEDADMDSMMTTFNTAVTETASDIRGKHRQKKKRRKKKNWVSSKILDLCDIRRELRKKRFEPEGPEKYRVS